MEKGNISTEYIRGLEILRNQNHERLEKASFRWNKMANDKSMEISKLLFSIASLVLPISFLPLTQNDFSLNGNNTALLFLILSWMLFISSLISGFFYLEEEVGFFNGWANQESNRSNAYTESILTTDSTKAFVKFSEMSQKSNELIKMANKSGSYFLVLQQIFLTVGLIFMGITLSIKLFTTEVQSTRSNSSTSESVVTTTELGYQ